MHTLPISWPAIRLAIVGFTLALLLIVPPASASERQAAVDARLAAIAERNQAIEALGEDVTVRWGSYGTVRRIRGHLDFWLPSAEALANSGEAVRERLSVPLGLQGAEHLTAPRLRAGAHGTTFLRFRQAIDGIPVAGAALALRFDASGRATAISVHVLVDEALPRTPSIEQDDAMARALAEAFPEATDAAVERVRLAYYLDPSGRGPLTWEVQVARRPADAPPEAYRVFVDALSGEVVTRHPLIFHGKFRNVYSANNGTNYTASLLIQEGGSTSDPDGDAVYDHAGIFYDFFNSAFNRDSFDGNGADMNSTVNYQQNYNNAFYDSSLDWFVYGDGDGTTWGPFGRSLDIVSHEMMHGVTQHSAQLVYLNESGAINEAYSDIFAAVIDADENGISAATWRIAEDAYKPSDPTSALRYMNDPTADGDSRDDYEDRYTGSEDNGGVHWNSGIANLAFYLLSQGGTHPRGVTSNNVPAIGMTKARNIFYNVLDKPCLSENETHAFAELRSCSFDEALDLYGASESDSVTEAFDAVRVPGSPNVPPDTPDDIQAISQMCFGWYSVEWSSSPGTDYYELWHAETTQNFTGGNLMYSGAETDAFVNIPYDGHLGVRACNGSGCSGFVSTGYLGRLSMCH